MFAPINFLMLFVFFDIMGWCVEILGWEVLDFHSGLGMSLIIYYRLIAYHIML